MCDHRESHFGEPFCEAKRNGLTSSVRSAGFIPGTSPCCPSTWGDKNGINHAALEPIDEAIQKSVTALLPEGLQILDERHQKMFEIHEKYHCHIW